MTTFNSDWVLYAFPPVPMLEQYIAAVIRHKQPVVLVVPEWKSQAWWARVVELGQHWLWLGRACDIFDGDTAHPFGRAFDAEQAQEHVFWAVSLFSK